MANYDFRFTNSTSVGNVATQGQRVTQLQMRSKLSSQESPGSNTNLSLHSVNFDKIGNN
jgi:hypothetical protein